jgi:UDP-N-acetylmuramate--alanine ligase
MLNRTGHIHFVGIGGAGMSAMAEVVRAMGYWVTGSDQQESAVSRRLAAHGVPVQYGHSPQHVCNADLVVYSSAVRPDNPERVYASGNGIPSMRRAEVLGDLMRGRFSIGIAGTHGKTTTTSLVGDILAAAACEPTVIVGGTLNSHGANAIVGTGNVMVVEADEYDRSFLSMYPQVAVITNVDVDHLDCYSNHDDIKGAFVQYANSVPFHGFVLVCIDDPGAESIIHQIGKPVVTYGTREGAAYRAVDIRAEEEATRFAVIHGALRLGEVELPMAGMHNLRNALAAAAVASEMGVGFGTIRHSLGSCRGVKRRFEVLGTAMGVHVVDDYAHHPSEIEATLQAARQRRGKRSIVVFQPHLFSRTRDFLDRFVKSLTPADMVIVTEIYRARESDDLQVSGADIVEGLQRAGHGNVRFVADKESIPAILVPELGEGDWVLLMGAGDINQIGTSLLEEIGNGPATRS